MVERCGVRSVSSAGALSAHGDSPRTASTRRSRSPRISPPDSKFNPRPRPAGSSSSFQGARHRPAMARSRRSTGTSATADGHRTHRRAHLRPAGQLRRDPDRHRQRRVLAARARLHRADAALRRRDCRRRRRSRSRRVGQPLAPQPCAHDGNDGFCGTPDRRRPCATSLGFNNGASIAVIDAPDRDRRASHRIRRASRRSGCDSPRPPGRSPSRGPRSRRDVAETVKKRQERRRSCKRKKVVQVRRRRRSRPA